MAKEKVKFDKLNLKSQTRDLTSLNIDKIGAIFPNVIVEKEDESGNITKGIDFELLQQLLSKELVEGTREKYHLNWPGKKASLLEANKPVTDTLRPDLANSKNWDNTQNIFIEGDNFKALKILQESYLGKIKMIYIDPPYNTGKDFVYSDKFTIEKSEYAEKIGQYDEEKNKLFKENFKTNPRYHSDWLSMMYSRLHIARDLLREDGVIFISIDDNEVHNLRKICDEIFGEENFQYMLSVVNNLNGNDNSSGLMETQEYCYIYSKNKNKFEMGVIGVENEELDLWYQDEFGFWKEGGSLKATGINAPRSARPNLYFPIYINEDTLDFSLQKSEYYNYEILPITDSLEMRWYWKKDKFIEDKNEVIVKKTSSGYSLYKKQRPPLGGLPSKRGKTTFYSPKYSSSHGNDSVRKLFSGAKIFDYPKSIHFISDLIKIANTKNSDIILDFFAGSSAAAHAVMQLNAEDGGNRKYIMVQLDEATDEKSEAYKAGYKTIAELSRERIRRAGDKIIADLKSKQSSSDLKVTSSKGGQDSTTDQTTSELDIGFRAFRVDSSNMKDTKVHPANIKQQDLMQLVDTIKADRSAEDLLIHILLSKALTLDLPIKTMKFKQNTVYIVGENDVIICVDPVLDISIVDDLAKLGADTAVFRDSSFANENDRIQLDTSFKNLSPRDTKITMI